MNFDQLKKRKAILNTGFDNTNQSAGRILNKNGKANVQKTGIPFFKKYSTFHVMLDMSWTKFLLLVSLFFFVVNLIFAIIYFLLGVGNIGVEKNLDNLHQFFESFFFSAQTITSVGYGRLNPLGVNVGIVSSFEAFVGLLMFAVLTGLVYGKFSKPRAFLIFSKNALIAPFKDGKAFMYRLASYKNNSLTELESEAVASFQIEKNGIFSTQYFPLKLTFSKVTTLALNWTIVHMIDEESPLWGFEEKDYKKNKIEVIVFLKAFDEHFCNIVKEKNSYTFDEIIHDAKFNPMYHLSDDGTKTILQLDKIDDYTKL